MTYFSTLQSLADTGVDCIVEMHLVSQKILTMFVGVMAHCCVVLIAECYNSHKHSQRRVSFIHVPISNKHKEGIANIPLHNLKLVRKGK